MLGCEDVSLLQTYKISTSRNCSEALIIHNTEARKTQVTTWFRLSTFGQEIIHIKNIHFGYFKTTRNCARVMEYEKQMMTHLRIL